MTKSRRQIGRQTGRRLFGRRGRKNERVSVGREQSDDDAARCVVEASATAAGRFCPPGEIRQSSREMGRGGRGNACAGRTSARSLDRRLKRRSGKVFSVNKYREIQMLSVLEKEES